MHDEPVINPMGAMSLAVQDDIGTSYSVGTGGCNRTEGGAAHGITMFTPAVPPDATRLIVITTEGPINISL